MLRAPLAAALLLAACAGPAEVPPPSRRSVDTPGGMRAMAVARAPGGPWIALVWETQGVLFAHPRGAPELVISTQVGSGPRAVAAFDPDGDGVDELAVANVDDRAIQRVAVRDGALVRTASIALSAPPFHVAARGSRVAAVVGIEEAERVIEVHDLGARTTALRPEPGAVATLIAPSGEVIALIPTRAEVVFGDGARASVCPGAFSGRATADLVVLACRSGGVDLLRGPAHAHAHLEGGATLYDVALADLDGDGLEDLAAVDLAPGLHVFHGSAGGGFEAPVREEISRGPIAVEALGDGELAVLAFEARKLELVSGAGRRQGGD